MTDETAKELQIPSTLVIGGRAVDGRRIEAVRYRRVCAEIANDVGGDPSSAQWLLIQRAAGLTVQLEMLETLIAQGKPVDAAEYATLCGTLIRTLTTLGLGRKAKDVSPKAQTIDAHAQAVRNADD